MPLLGIHKIYYCVTKIGERSLDHIQYHLRELLSHSMIIIIPLHIQIMVSMVEACAAHQSLYRKGVYMLSIYHHE
jgi:hypothetical protein